MPEASAPRTWTCDEATPRAAADLAARLDLPQWVAQVLCARGLAQPEEARAFLDPSLARLPSFAGLAGLEDALAVLVPAIEAGRIIGVAGDYDADGVAGVALLVDFLRASGVRVAWDLPHRLHEGYGFSPAMAERLAAAGAEVAITVDCGISDVAGVARAAELGMQVVISDHHQLPPGPLVGAAAVINPQRPECALSPHLAGVGVAFYLAAGLRAALSEAGWYQGRRTPNLRESLDLVALGTCADVVPLKEANRILVSQGLGVLAEQRRPGLKALARVAGLAPPFSSRDIGFGLAPRVNAAGRVDHPSRALELLICRDPARAAALAAELDGLNRRRREVEEEMLAQALELAQAPAAQEAACLVLAQAGWHRGVLGIVASRMVEATGRPSLLVSTENGHAHASGRSVEGFHLQKALAGAAGLLTTYGGHAMAAGCSLPTEAVPQLSQALDRAAGLALAGREGPPPLELEAWAGVSDLLRGGLEVLDRLAPFGQGNPEPLLGLRGLNVLQARMIKGTHLKLVCDQGGHRLPTIAFGWTGAVPQVGQAVDLAGSPLASDYGGRHLELHMRDWRPAR